MRQSIAILFAITLCVSSVYSQIDFKRILQDMSVPPMAGDVSATNNDSTSTSSSDVAQPTSLPSNTFTAGDYCTCSVTCQCTKPSCTNVLPESGNNTNGTCPPSSVALLSRLVALVPTTLIQSNGFSNGSMGGVAPTTNALGAIAISGSTASTTVVVSANNDIIAQTASGVTLIIGSHFSGIILVGPCGFILQIDAGGSYLYRYSYTSTVYKGPELSVTNQQQISYVLIAAIGSL